MRSAVLWCAVLACGLSFAAPATLHADRNFHGVRVGGHYFRSTHAHHGRVVGWSHRPSLSYRYSHRPHYSHYPRHHYSSFAYHARPWSSYRVYQHRSLYFGSYRPYYYGHYRPVGSVYFSVSRPVTSYRTHIYSYGAPAGCFVYPTGFGGWYGQTASGPLNVVDVRSVMLAATDESASRRADAVATAFRPAVMDAAPVPASERSAGRSVVLTSADLSPARESTPTPHADSSTIERRRGEDLMLDLGDRLFRAGLYRQAADQYQAAAELPPVEATALFRSGHALIAAGRYPEAAAAFKRGLAVDPTHVARSGMRLSQLYSNDSEATARIEALAAAALKNASDSDLMFLIGVFLHFEGQPERAVRFFDRAANLAKGDASHIRAFLQPDETHTHATTLARTDAGRRL